MRVFYFQPCDWSVVTSDWWNYLTRLAQLPVILPRGNERMYSVVYTDQSKLNSLILGQPRIIEFRGCVVRTGGGLFKILFDVACSTVQHKLLFLKISPFVLLAQMPL